MKQTTPKKKIDHMVKNLFNDLSGVQRHHNERDIGRTIVSNMELMNQWYPILVCYYITNEHSLGIWFNLYC